MREKCKEKKLGLCLFGSRNLEDGGRTAVGDVSGVGGIVDDDGTIGGGEINETAKLGSGGGCSGGIVGRAEEDDIGSGSV